MFKSLLLLSLASGFFTMSGCLSTKKNPLYCNEVTPCTMPDRPYCDLAKAECESTAPDGFVPSDMSTRPDGAPPAECATSSECTATSVPICDSAGSCVACTADQQCQSKSAGTARCASTGECVFCLAPNTASPQCSGTTPICAADSSSCRKCAAHTECDSGVCASDGSCVDATDILYADSNPGKCVSSGPGTSKAMPYCQVSDATTAALLASKHYVVVAGSSTPYGGVTISGGTVTIVGPGKTATTTAKIGPTSQANAILVQTAGIAATVSIDGMELVGLGSSQAGVKCSSGVGVATVTVHNSLLQSSGGAGVDSSGCTLTLDANVVSGNQGAGVSMSSSTNYTVTNNLIFNNGASAGNPGILIADAASTGTIAFNTVAKNGGLNSVEGGVACPSTGAVKIVSNSIVANNSSNGGTQFAGKCQIQNVVTGADSFAGATMLAPAFVSAANDFHLKVGDSTSDTANNACCIDKITTDPTTPNKDHDVDLSARKKGLGWDIGAHEVR